MRDRMQERWLELVDTRAWAHLPWSWWYTGSKILSHAVRDWRHSKLSFLKNFFSLGSLDRGKPVQPAIRSLPNVQRAWWATYWAQDHADQEKIRSRELRIKLTRKSKGVIQGEVVPGDQPILCELKAVA